MPLAELFGAIDPSLVDAFASPTVAQLQGSPRTHQAEWRDVKGARSGVTVSSPLQFAVVEVPYRVGVVVELPLQRHPQNLAVGAA